MQYLIFKSVFEKIQEINLVIFIIILDYITNGFIDIIKML